MRPCPFLSHSGRGVLFPAGRSASPRRQPLDPRCLATSISATAAIAASAAASGRDGRVGGIDPRDAVVGFDIGLGDRSQPRVLPTNVVCVYAPRFAEVRVSTGTHQNVDIQTSKTDKVIEKSSQASTAALAKRLVQNQAAELARNRARASGLKGKVRADEESNNRGTQRLLG